MTAGRGTPDLAAVLDWMRRDGRRYLRMRDFSDALCKRVVAAGIPVARAFFAVATLHPQIAAAAYIWRRDGGTAREAATREDMQRPDIRDSPRPVSPITGRSCGAGSTIRPNATITRSSNGCMPRA